MLDRGSDYARETSPKVDKHNVTGDLLEFGRNVHADSNAHQKDWAPSPLTSILSGVTNALLMVCISGSFGWAMFVDAWNARHVALGAKMNLVTGAVLCLCFGMSKGKVLLGGPDALASVFYGSAISKMGKHVAGKVGITYPTPAATRRLLGHVLYSPEDDPQSESWFFGETQIRDWAESLSLGERRSSEARWALESVLRNVGNYSLEEVFEYSHANHGRLLQTSNDTVQVDTENWCSGTHYNINKQACDDYHKKFRATALALIVAGSLGIGLIFGLLGLAEATRFVDFIPRGIADAILACCGYKIFVFALLFCSDKPRIFLPAALGGVPLYFIISGPVLYPGVMVPLFIGGGIGIFFIWLSASGSSLDAARSEGLMFPKVDDCGIWTVYTESLLKMDDIQWDAWQEMLPDLAVLWLALLIDGLGQLRMTDEKVPALFWKDWESSVMGAGNVIGGLLGGSAGCSQVLLNVANYGTIRNTQDRSASLLCGIICAAFVFVPASYLDYLPRKFYGAILFCMGSRFVAEHLWNSRKYLSTPEWLQIIIIVGVFVLLDEILYGVGVGVALIGANFIAKYAKVPCIEGKPLRGGELASRERHSPLMTRSIMHIANSWVLVLRLKGYCFFASVHGVIAHVRGIIEKQRRENTPEFRCLKYLIIDGDHLDGIDSAASKDFQRLRDEAIGHGMSVIWTAVNQEVLQIAKQRGTIVSDADVFHDLAEAMLFIEQKIRVFRHTIEEKWIALHPMFAQAQELTRMRENFEPFRSVFPFDAARFGCPWMYVNKKSITAMKTVLWENGMLDIDLFLIHTGAVGIFDTMPDPSDGYDQPIVVYKHGWFLNRQFLVREPTRGIAVALEDGEILSWNTHQWWRMTRERPLMSSAIMEMAMRQSGFDSTIMQNQLKLTADVDISASGEVDMSHLDLAEKDIMQHDIPHDLQQKIEGIEAAQFLKEFKLYEPISADDSATALPEMPRKIRDDLAIAFYTFANDAGGGRQMLPGKKVKEALMYAGIFNMLVGMKEMDRPLEEKDFLAIGHETAMARLTKKQVSKVYNIFKSYDKDKSGQLDRDEMIIIFRETFTPNISEEEVNGICGAWDDNGSGKIDAKEFVGILARFIRKHEQDWNLLVGFREVLQKRKKEAITMKDTLTVELLMGNGRVPLTQEQAEEMLWACDCFDLEGDGKELDFAGFVAGVLLSTEYNFGELPPLPRKAPKRVGNNQLAPPGGALFVGAQPSDRSSSAGSRAKKKPMKRASSEDSDDEIIVGKPRQAAPSWSSGSSKAKVDSRRKPPVEKNLKNRLLDYRKDQLVKADIPDTCMAKAHVFLNYPSSSYPAQIYSTIMSLLIVATFVQLVVQTFIQSESSITYCPKSIPYPYFTGNSWCCATNRETVYAPQGRSCDGSDFHVGGFISKCCFGGVQTRCSTPPCSTYDEPNTAVYDNINLVITIIFSIEYVLRFALCHALGDYRAAWIAVGAFIIDPLNLTDLAAVLPFWIDLAFDTGDSSFWRLLRLGRVMSVASQHGAAADGRNLQKVSSRTAFVLPLCVVLVVIWAIYWKGNNPNSLNVSSVTR